MTENRMIGRLRLVDAVVIAALALLALKGLSYLTASPAKPPLLSGVRAGSGVVPAEEQLPKFARALAQARQNYVPPDVDATFATGTKDEKPAASPPPPDPRSAPPALQVPAPPPSPAERALLERLGERRDALQQKNRDLDLRERLLENTERKLDTRLNELKGLEERVQAESAKRNDGEAHALKNLVLMYETMKPKDAARVFDRLPHDVLVPVVLQMNPRKMAEVLALMGPEAAEKLTVALALRARGAEAPRVGVAAGAPPAPNELPGIDAPRPAAR